MTVDTQKLRELLEKATPGPWRWEYSAESRRVHLVGGKPQYDLTIMDFTRWGMNGSGIRLRDVAHDGMNLMHKLHERSDWIAPFPDRDHHKHWCAAVAHPDMQLMTNAVTALPALLDEIDRLRAALDGLFTDMIIAQGNMRDAAKHDPRWEGCAEEIQPRVDAARAALNPPAPPQGEKE